MLQVNENCSLGVALQLAGQERRRAQLVTTLTLLLVAFVMVTAVISGLATRHSSVETPLDANVTGQDHVGLHQGQTDELAEEGLVDLSKEWSDQAEQGVGEVAEAVEVEGVVEGVDGDMEDEDQQTLYYQAPEPQPESKQLWEEVSQGDD